MKATYLVFVGLRVKRNLYMLVNNKLLTDKAAAVANILLKVICSGIELHINHRSSLALTITHGSMYLASKAASSIIMSIYSTSWYCVT